MSRIVFLVEEFSMKVLLDGMLPRFFPGLEFLCVPHEGKQDLMRSVPRKLRAWREPGVRFVVLRDNDGGDCQELKASLRQLCHDGGRADALVRIACQELEAWYLGEPDALAEAFNEESLRGIAGRARYRESDDVVRPSAEMVRLVPEFQKVSGARRMGPWLTRERNRSRSFRVLVSGVERLAATLRVGTQGDGA
jgi:hypothetical protein